MNALTLMVTLSIITLLLSVPALGSEAAIKSKVEEPRYSFQCSVDQAGTKPKENHRLSRLQYTNTLRDLLALAYTPPINTEIFERLQSDLDFIPKDDSPGSFDGLDHRISGAHIMGYFRVAKAFASHVTASTDRMSGFVSQECAQQKPTEACRRSFLEKWGPIILRRPLTAADLNLYLPINSYFELISTLLMSPDFLYIYHFEGETKGRNEPRPLNTYELASRLSYLFWQTMPDKFLRLDAENGKLAHNYEAVVDRVFNDPKTKRMSRAFFDGWLQLSKIPEIDSSAPEFPAFLAIDYGFDNQLPLEIDLQQYRLAAIEEIHSLTDYYIWEVNGTLYDLYNSDLSFVNYPPLAQAYAVPLWRQNYNDIPTFNFGQRSGILTRAALHMYGRQSTRPILKGVRIRRDILCDDLHPPLNNEPPREAVVHPEYSTIEKVKAITEIEGSFCSSCHLTMINPLGFITEQYDSLGRYRNFEVVFDHTGKEIARPNITVKTKPFVDFTDQRQINNTVDLSQLVSENPKSNACFARQYFRFAYARKEDQFHDGCSLQALEKQARHQHLRSFLRSVALQPQFKMK